MRSLMLVILLAVASSPARGGELDISGSLELQARTFWHDPQWVGQDDQALQGSVVSIAEFRWRSEDGNQRASFIPYLRWDANDDERSLSDLSEA